MKLSQDILYFRLLLNYPVKFFNRNETYKKYGYPIIYEAGADLSDHVVIIRTDDLEELLGKAEQKGSLFVCFGKMLKNMLNMPSVIFIEKNVSLISVNNYLLKTYDEFEKWDNSLKNVICEGGSFQDLINCCDPIIIEPIAIMDKEFKIVADSELSKELGYDIDLDDDDRISLEGFNTVMTELDYNSLCSIRDTYIFPFANGRNIGRNIFDKEEFVGRIAIYLSTNEEYLQNFNNAILEHFYFYAVKLYNKYSSFKVRGFSNNRLATLLTDSLTNKKIPEKLWEEAFKENNWDNKSLFMLVQFIPIPLKEKNIKNTYSEFISCKVGNKWNESLCFIYMERLLLLININKSTGYGKPDLFETLADFSKNNHLIAGVSRIFCGIKYLRSAYEQTEAAIEHGTANHPADSFYKFDDYALDYMLHSCKGIFENEEICSSKLVSLVQYDKEKGTPYYKTLCTYFECKYNAAEAAKRLFINRSTFLYRLERIQALININFDSNDELLYSAISFKILDQWQNNK